MEEHPRNGQSRNTSVPRINEEYITQVSEEIEGRITKKLSQEFNRIESRISDALSKLDEFLSNQQIQTHSKTVPGTFRNTNVENQGTNEDDSQSDPHPEAGIFRGQTTQNSGPKDCRLTFTQIIIFSNHFVNISSFPRFQFLLLFTTMYRNPSPNSTNSDVFYVEHFLPETSPIRNNTPVILNSTQLSEAMDPETITISSVASPEPQLVTLESDSNEPTFPYAFGAQHPIVRPSLNDLNLPPNPFNVLATMAVIQQDQEQNPQSPEPSDLSPISTPP